MMDPKGRKTMRQLMQGTKKSFEALTALLQLLGDGKIEGEAEPKSKRQSRWETVLSEIDGQIKIGPETVRDGLDYKERRMNDDAVVDRQVK
jgi:beta-xylosidase